MPRPVAGDLLYLCIVSVLVVVKVTSLVSQPLDPYQPLDRAVYLLTGGLWNWDYCWVSGPGFKSGITFSYKPPDIGFTTLKYPEKVLKNCIPIEFFF